MKTIRKLISVIFFCAVIFTGAGDRSFLFAHGTGHSAISKHGGIVYTEGGLHIEFVAQSNGTLDFYFYDLKGEGIDVSSSSGGLILYPNAADSKRFDIEGDPADPGHLIAQIPAAEKYETVHIKFDLKLDTDKQPIETELWAVIR